MKAHLFFIVFTSISLCACISPQTKEAHLARVAEPCLENETELDKAISCLEAKGYKRWHHYRNAHSLRSCGPYWGYPLVASCSGIIIEHQDNEIKSYKLWAELDGV